MKLARYMLNGPEKIGAIVDAGVISLNSIGFEIDNMISLIEQGPDLLHQISGELRRGDPVPLDRVTLLAPLRPNKFLGLGMNYRRHVDEARKLGIDVPDNQIWFNKQTSCINGPYAEVEKGVTEKLDYEVELGVVIGKPAKSVNASSAMDHVFGYLVVNDVSARDWQFHSPTFTLGKSFDTHGPIGPWITTADEIKKPDDLNIRCLVNGQVRQNSNTEQFIHSIAQQIEYLSTAFTLEPGDIIATGTPEGVGAAMQPPTFLQPGDVVRCEIEGLGHLENTVVA